MVFKVVEEKQTSRERQRRRGGEAAKAYDALFALF